MQKQFDQILQQLEKIETALICEIIAQILWEQSLVLWNRIYLSISKALWL